MKAIFYFLLKSVDNWRKQIIFQTNKIIACKIVDIPKLFQNKFQSPLFVKSK